MSFPNANKNTTDTLLAQIKELSGRRLEDERRLRRLTQRQLALRSDISIRWLREIENGNPVVRLDDHLRCAAAMGMAPIWFLLPLLDGRDGQPLVIDLNVGAIDDFQRHFVDYAIQHIRMRKASGE